jgi:ATP/maltotriose-dependent transcriptional regulator MalT
LTGDRDDTLRSEILLAMGSLMMTGGRFAEVAGALDEAAELADRVGARRIWLRTQVERAFLDVFLDEETAAAAIEEVATTIQPELEELEDDLGIAKAWALRSEPYNVSCQWATRCEMLDRALEHARRSGERRVVSNLAGQLFSALLFGPTPAGEAARRCEASLDESRLGALGALAVLNAMQGDFETARAQWAETAAGYEELGQRFRRATRSLLGAQIELLSGAPDAAVRELEFGESELAAMGERGVRSTIAATLANAQYAAGDLDGAHESSVRAEEFTEPNDIGTQVLWRTARAQVLAERGDHATAEALSTEAERLVAPAQFPDLQATVLLGRARVLTLAGRSADAAGYTERARALYEAKGNVMAAQRLG